MKRGGDGLVFVALYIVVADRSGSFLHLYVHRPETVAYRDIEQVGVVILPVSGVSRIAGI